MWVRILQKNFNIFIPVTHTLRWVSATVLKQTVLTPVHFDALSRPFSTKNESKPLLFLGTNGQTFSAKITGPLSHFEHCSETSVHEFQYCDLLTFGAGVLHLIQINHQPDANHHSLSGAHTTVPTASCICHTVTAICRYRGRVGTGLSVL
jgi:hypothetical protein